MAGGMPHQVLAGEYPGVPPPPDLGWGTPHQLDGVPPTWTSDGVPPISWMEYPSHLDLGCGTSISWMGYPPCLDLGWGIPISWMGYHPCLDLGWGTPAWDVVPPSRSGMGYPPPVQTWDGVPPPPSMCGLTNKLKTVPSPSFECGRQKLIYPNRSTLSPDCRNLPGRWWIQGSARDTFSRHPLG